MKIKSKLQFPVEIAIMSFAVFSMIFQGCEKEELTPENDLPYLSIEGDLNNPQTLLEPKNFIIFNKASERIEKHLSVENDRLICNINDGTQIAVSNKIFKYMQQYFNEINKQIDSSKITIAINTRGHIIIHNRNHAIFYKKVRLKSGEIEDEYQQINVNGMSDQDIVANINLLFNGLQSGIIDFDYLDQYIDLDSVTPGGGKSYGIHKRGSYTNNGVTITYTIANPCLNTPNNNCWSSYIGILNTEVDSQGRIVYKQILNTTGNGLVSLWYTYPL